MNKHLRFPKYQRFWTTWRTYVRRVSCPKVTTSVNGTKRQHHDMEYSNLSNGLRIVTETRPESPYACIGLYIDAGSRYECKYENGLVHFFEHLAFKQTKKRSRTELLKALTATGANFSSFTTREMVCFYAQCLKPQVKPVVELLCDCIFNNALADSEIKNQKTLVYNEMLRSDKDHNTILYDYLHSAAFQGTPLEQSVIGPSENIHNYNNCTIDLYLNSYFVPNRMVLAGVGAVTHNQMRVLATQYLGCLFPRKIRDTTPHRYTGSDVRFRDDSMPVGNVIIAVEGPSLCDADNVAMEIARCAVGGWDRSQLAGEILAAEVARTASSKNLCDAFAAFNINYKDTGLWGVQFISDALSLDDMSILIQGQWMYLCNCITETEVDKAKKFLKTYTISKMQSATEACHDAGRWVLYHGTRPSLQDKLKEIDNVTAADVRRVCTKYLYDRCPTVAAMGKVEGLMEYQRIRSGMFWLRT